MSRSSALARVIGLTKSLSPLSHGRAAEGSSDTDDIVAGVLAEEAQASPAPLALVAAPAGPADAAAIEPAEDSGSATAPALARVTLVAAESATPPAPVDAVRRAVTAEAIDAIEADIASLLSSLDNSGAAPTRSTDDGEEELDEAGDEDERLAGLDEDDVEGATQLLLSELDRLWRADPAIGRGSYLH
jgi:hypothetical protein